MDAQFVLGDIRDYYFQASPKFTAVLIKGIQIIVQAITTGAQREHKGEHKGREHKGTVLSCPF